MKARTTVLLMLMSASLVHAQEADLAPSVSLKQERPGVFGDLNMGISNYGMAGALTLYYRTGNKFLSAGYYQSHLCTAGEYDGIPFWSSGAVTHHVSIQSYSAGFGYILPRKLRQGISAGISVNKIATETTDPILHDLSLGGVIRELAGEGFEVHSHGSHPQLVVGIPIEYKVFLFTKGTIGLDLGARVDLNMARIFGSITLGVRVGKC